MFYKKQGFPQEGELVLCTVTKIKYHSVFVNIDEYNKGGMIHISEVAPGRIRNISDYVKEGKVVVCKVLRIDKEKGHVDLSLRRVSENQRRNKVNEIKHEKKAESIIIYVANQLKIDPKTLYEKIKPKIFDKYDFLFECFEEVVEKGSKLTNLGIEKDLAAKLEELIKLRIKPKEVEIGGIFFLENHDGEGVEIIRASLNKALDVEGVDINYLGGGKYKVIVKSKNYKSAESILEEATESVLNYIRERNGKGEFVRDQK
jgi:translation initiation factor 2 subunit 1